MDNDKLLVQHNVITMARYNITTSEQNIVYMLLAQLNKNDPYDKVYRLS